jgi:hypothetical protein
MKKVVLLAALIQGWNFRTINGGKEPSRKRVVVPSPQATWAGEMDSLKSIPGLLKRLKIRAQET